MLTGLDRYEINKDSESVFRGLTIRDIISDSLTSMLSDITFEEDQSLLDDGDSSILSNWILVHTRHPKDDAERFSLNGREYCIPIINDPAKHVAVKKAAQTSISEIMVRESVARLIKYPSTKCLYALPTYDDVQFFSDTRIATVLEKSPTIQRLNRKKDNQSMKQIGDSFLIIRGGAEYRHAQMLDIDWLFIDEYDRHKESLIPSFQERMSGSRYQFQRDFSTPSVEGIGIDKVYELSDKKIWLDVCWNCEHNQQVWEENIKYRELEDKNEYYYACLKCGEELYRERRKGFWKSTTKSDLGISGYHVSQFMSATINASQMVEAKATITIPQDYQNLKLGLAVGGGLSDSDMAYGRIGAHAATLDANLGGKGVMSVDWGADWSWAEVSVPSEDTDERIVVWVECFFSNRPSDHARRMAEVAVRTGSGYIIADLGFGHSPAEHMKEVFGDKFFTISTNSDSQLEPRFDFKKRHVTWGKLRCLKTHFGLLRQEKVILPATSPLIPVNKQEKKMAHEIWIDHHKNTKIRQAKEIRQVQGAAPVKETVEAAGPIHLCVTSAYADAFYYYLKKKREEDQQNHRRAFRARVV